MNKHDGDDDEDKLSWSTERGVLRAQVRCDRCHVDCTKFAEDVHPQFI